MTKDKNGHTDGKWQSFISFPITYDQFIASANRELIFEAVEQCNSNRTAAAELLGLSYRSFRYRAGIAGLGKLTNQRLGARSVFERVWPRLRMDAFKRYGSNCHCCGAGVNDGVRLDVDHIKPRNRFPGSELDIENLQILCRQCHASKGPHDETDWRTKRQ